MCIRQVRVGVVRTMAVMPRRKDPDNVIEDKHFSEGGERKKRREKRRKS